MKAFQKISAIAAKIERLVNNAAYVFEIVTWGLNALRQLSGILASFPKPAITDEEKKSDIVPQPNSERPAGSEEQ